MNAEEKELCILDRDPLYCVGVYMLMYVPLALILQEPMVIVFPVIAVAVMFSVAVLFPVMLYAAALDFVFGTPYFDALREFISRAVL